MLKWSIIMLKLLCSINVERAFYKKHCCSNIHNARINVRSVHYRYYLEIKQQKPHNIASVVGYDRARNSRTGQAAPSQCDIITMPFEEHNNKLVHLNMKYDTSTYETCCSYLCSWINGMAALRSLMKDAVGISPTQKHNRWSCNLRQADSRRWNMRMLHAVAYFLEIFGICWASRL